FGYELRAETEIDLRFVQILERRGMQPLEPGDHGVDGRGVTDVDTLHRRAPPQIERLTEQPRAIRVATTARPIDELFEAESVDGAGFHHQPVTAGLPVERPLR